MFQVKSVKDIKQAIDKFLSTHLTKQDIKIQVSDAWYPFPKYESENDTIALVGGKAGIYIFSDPNTPWSVKLEDNNSDIWYIGKSINTTNQTIRKRVWNHLDPVNGAKRTILDNGKSTNALFTAEVWDSRSNVPQHIRDAIVLGKFVAYSVRIDSLADQPDLVRELEAYLIESYRTTNGKRPIFNIVS